MGKVGGIEELTEEERKALRGSKFAPLPPTPPNKPSSSATTSFSRVAHPGGPLTTNKAAALAKFLERKLQEPGGLDTLKPELIELAVKNAKETIHASGTSKSGRTIRHVASFDESEDIGSGDERLTEVIEPKKKKQKKEKKKKQKQKNNKKGKNFISSMKL